MLTRATRAIAAIATLLYLAPPTHAQAPDDGDSPELAQRYDDAFDALVRGDLDAATAGFEEVAETSRDPERRAAARELARLARTMRARVAAVGPGTATSASDKPLHVGATEADTDASGRSGRTEFVIMTTATSLYAGIVLMDLLDAEEFRSGTLIITGATAAGFLASFYGTRGRNITNGMADSYSAGLLLGAANGFLLAEPLGLDDSEEVLSFALATTAVGGAGALWLADAFRPSRAQPALTMNLAYAGAATVGWGLAIAQPDIEADTVLTLLAGGLDAGALAGVLIAPELDWSYSRARYVGLGTFLGSLGGFALGAILIGDPSDGDDDDGRLAAGATLAGMWAGFGLTVHLTRNMSPEPTRVARTATDDTLVVPTVIAGGPGVGIAGTF